MTSPETVIIEHYRKEAAAKGLAATSTMHDEIVRAREVDAIVACVAYACSEVSGNRLLDIGCGNGYLLDVLRGRFPQLELIGRDYSEEMVALAGARGLERCDVKRGDARAIDLPDDDVDIVVSERCVVNILDEDEQYQAFSEIARVLAPGGFYVCIEAFTDGLENLNRARSELGLDPNEAPYHNLWLSEETFRNRTAELFDVASPEHMAEFGLPQQNFLSSHYFVSRVLYPAVTAREVMYNTEFARFFAFLPPYGNYAPIQLLLCRKRD